MQTWYFTSFLLLLSSRLGEISFQSSPHQSGTLKFQPVGDYFAKFSPPRFCVFVCMSVLRFLATSYEVVRRRYTSPVDTVSLLAKFCPIFWYVRPLYDKNWRF